MMLLALERANEERKTEAVVCLHHDGIHTTCG
jgi:hypothetical protein